MKKKILIVNNNFDTGGVQRALINLLNHIHNHFDVTVFVFSNSGSYKDMVPKSVRVVEASPLLNLLGLSQQDARKKGIILYCIRGALALYARIINNYLPLWVLIGTQRKMAGFDTAISFLHCGTKDLLYGGCNEFVLNRVVAKQKIAFIHCDFLNNGGNSKHNRELYRRFDKIAAVSEGCRSAFVKAIPDLAEKAFCVPNFHIYSEYRSAAENDPLIYSNNKQTLNVVTISRISAEKGILRGIDAVGALIRNGYDLTWHIIGDGNQRNLAMEKIELDGLTEKIILHGDQINPYRYLKNASVLFLPSFHEAAPMVIGEAKSLGVPVITTETTSAKEMVIQDSEGFVCGNDYESIYQALKDVMDNPDKLVLCRKYLEGTDYNNDKAAIGFFGLIE